MAVNITPVFANTNTFGDWLQKTNEIANAISTMVVSVNSANPPTGNVVIQGRLATNTVHISTLSGGTLTTPATLNVSTQINFQNTAIFSAATNDLVNLSNFIVPGATAQFRVVGSNTATGRLEFVNPIMIGQNTNGDFTLVGNAAITNISANNAVFENQVTANTIVSVSISGNGSALTSLNGSQITTGTINNARIGVLPASKITSGVFDSDRLAGSYTGITGTGILAAGSITSTFGNINIGTSTFTGNGSALTSLNGSEITTGTIAAARIGVLDANKITTGSFDAARIPSLDASKISTGILNTSRLASGVANTATFLRGDSTWFEFNVDANGSITTINASNIVSGTVDAAYLGSGTRNANTYLRGNNTWGSLDANQILSGTLPTARLTGSYTGITGTGILAAGSITSTFGDINIGTSVFTGNGSGITALNGSNITTGTVAAARVGDLDAAKTTTGVFSTDRIPNLDAAKITTGSIASARLSGSYTEITGTGILAAGSITSTFGNINIGTNIFTGNGSGITALNGSNITTGTVAAARVGDLPASKITSGAFNADRIPSLDASKITTGAFNADRIPSLDATKVTSGSFDASRIGDLPASKISSGTFPSARLFGAYTGVTELGTLIGLNVANTVTAGFFSGNGASLTALNGSNITTGTLSDARLPSTMSAKTFSARSTFAAPSDSAQIKLERTGTSTGSAHIGADNGGLRFYNASLTQTSIIDASGNFTATGNVTAYSDANLKTDVSTINNALDLIDEMRGVRYTRIDNGDHGIGVIAQEIQQVVPEVVIKGEEYLSVAYGNLAGVFIEAIKELREENRLLKSRLEALESIS
jgi:hypothetical protein